MDETKLAVESASRLSLIKDALPLLGVIVGAGLQYLFSYSAEIKRHERTLRVEAGQQLLSLGLAETGKGFQLVAGANESLKVIIEPHR